MRRGPILAMVAVLLAWPWLMGADAPKTGTVKVATAGLTVTVRPASMGPNRAECTITDAKEATLRPGRYEAVSVRYTVKDDKGQTWVLNGEKDFGSFAGLEVTADNTTTLEGGPPLAPKITAEIQQARPTKGAVRAPEAGGPKMVMVYYRLEGRAGETYEPRAMRGVAPGPLPAVRIVDEAGKVLSEGRYSPGRVGALGMPSAIAEWIQGFA